jgi:hypothetical protein
VNGAHLLRRQSDVFDFPQATIETARFASQAQQK